MKNHINKEEIQGNTAFTLQDWQSLIRFSNQAIIINDSLKEQLIKSQTYTDEQLLKIEQERQYMIGLNKKLNLLAKLFIRLYNH